MEDKENHPDMRLDLPDGDYVAFIPVGEIRAIERAICNMEQVRQEFRKIGEDIKSTDDAVES
jgi:hypothetical protein